MTAAWLLTAPATGDDTGVGGVVALLVVLGLFVFGTTVYKRWQALHDASPTPQGSDGVIGVTTLKRDPVDPTDPTTDPIEREWGAVDYHGTRSRVAVAADTGPVTRPEFDRWVQAQLSANRPAAVIREAKARFGRSQATTKRAIRRARGEAA